MNKKRFIGFIIILFAVFSGVLLWLRFQGQGIPDTHDISYVSISCNYYMDRSGLCKGIIPSINVNSDSILNDFRHCKNWRNIPILLVCKCSPQFEIKLFSKDTVLMLAMQAFLDKSDSWIEIINANGKSVYKSIPNTLVTRLQDICKNLPPKEGWRKI